jgi:small-conductance mechanosensitive channel
MAKRFDDDEPYVQRSIRALGKIIALEMAMVAVFVVMVYSYGEGLDFHAIQDMIISMTPSLLTFFLLVLITKISLDLVQAPFRKVIRFYSRSETTAKMVWRSLSYIIWSIVLLILVIVLWGSAIEPGALVGVAVIIAAIVYVNGKPLTNFVGWMVIVARGPYKIGDRIEVDGKKGYVIDITLMATHVREFGGWMEGDTFTGRLLAIPNSKVFETEIINYSNHGDFVYDEVQVAITYESDYNKAEQILMDSSEEIIGDFMRENRVRLKKYVEVKALDDHMPRKPRVAWRATDSSVQFSLIYLTSIKDRREISTKITRKILTAIQKDDDVHIAYPHVAVVGVNGQPLKK